jgi:hypothetical protein
MRMVVSLPNVPFIAAGAPAGVTENHNRRGSSRRTRIFTPNTPKK